MYLPFNGCCRIRCKMLQCFCGCTLFSWECVERVDFREKNSGSGLFVPFPSLTFSWKATLTRHFLRCRYIIQEECEFVQYFFCIFWQKNVNYSAHSPQSRKNGRKNACRTAKILIRTFFEIAHINRCGALRMLCINNKRRSAGGESEPNIYILNLKILMSAMCWLWCLVQL